MPTPTLTVPKLKVRDSVELAREGSTRWVLSKSRRDSYSAHEETESDIPGFWTWNIFGAWSKRAATAEECVKAVECRIGALTAPR